MFRLVILALILLGSGARAHSGELPTLEQFDWQMADDPWTVYGWSEAAFQSMTPQTSEAEKIRITGYFIIAAVQIQKLEVMTAHLQDIEDSWQKSGALAMNRDRTNMGFALGMYYRLLNQTDKSDVYYKLTIEESRRFHDDDCLIQILLNYAQDIDMGARNTEAFQYFHEAQEMAADESRNIQPLHREMARIIAALTLEEKEQTDATQLIETSMKYFIETRPRFTLSSFAFNVGRIFIGKNVDKALEYYDLSLREARSIKDQSTIGAVLAEQADIANRRGQHAEAEKKAAEAARVIGDSDRHWLGRALGEQALSLWKLKRLKEALQISGRALDLISKENLKRYVFILETRAAVQEELGLFQDAVQTHKTMKAALAKASKETLSDNFAKAKVQLGLQVEEQKNMLLQKENELQASRLKISRYLFMAAIALGILLIGAVISTIWALSNARQIQKAKEKIQIILDVIEEGILTINHRLLPEPEYSRYLTQLYPELFQGQGDAIDWLFPETAISGEKRSMIRETLRACLGEEILGWTLNEGHLPTEIVLPGPSPRAIHLLWQPLLDGNDRIRGFLLSLRDISEQKILQNEVKIQQQRAQALETRVQEILLTRFQDASRLLQSLQEQLNQPAENWLDASRRRDLHTRKGEARTLGLKGLSQAIHHLETALAQAEDEGQKLAVEQLREAVKSYSTLMNDVFANRSTHEASATTLIETVGTMLPAFKKQLAEGEVAVQAIEVNDAVVHWPEPILDAVRQNLLHALANSADHGYILPGRRGKALSPAVFRVEAELRSNAIEVRVRDFGVGLDNLRLAEMAKARGFTPSGQETVADVVFLDGATTAEQASATSGRGVGLAAVRELCQRFQGAAYLRPNELGSGSLLVMTFARREFVKTA